MSAFSIGTVVTWSSQSQGRSTKKDGVVVAYVHPGERPNRDSFPDLYSGIGCGYGRSTESYVVRVGRKHYWPNASKLRLSATCPHCGRSGETAMSAELKAGLLAAADFSGNFATAKPNINDTEQQHILGLVALLRAAADALPGDGKEWIAGYMQGANDYVSGAQGAMDQDELRADAEMAQRHYAAEIAAAPQPETSK